VDQVLPKNFGIKIARKFCPGWRFIQSVPEGVGDAAEDEEEDVEAGQREEERVEHVAKLRPRKHDLQRTLACYTGLPDGLF
jgi:hypothetical protein